jgi:hypothetical protein
MKRFFTSLAAISLVGTIGRHPAIAGILMLLGVGGGATAIAVLTPPTIVPFISANFNPNQMIGGTNNGLKPNGGTAGASLLPAGNSSGGATGSFAYYFEATVNPNLSYGNGSAEGLFPGIFIQGNTSPGQPTFVVQKAANGGVPGSQWWQLPSIIPTGTQNAAAGSNYATGLYPFTASGGGCAVEPTGVWLGSGSPINIVSPGFGCQTAPTFSAATIPNAGAQQTGITATCAAGAPGFLNIKTSLPVSPGLSPGLTYPVNFSTTGGTPTNLLTSANLTAVSITGSGPYLLVGTIAGTVCPTTIATGTLQSGASGAYTFPALSASAPFAAGGTGITTNNGQHICGIIGEYGDDSPFPGAQFMSIVDEKGNALPGAPALVQNPNMGTADFIGSTSASSATMNVSAMNPHTITSAAWALGSGTLASTGLVTFQVSSNPGYAPGSQFTVSGMSPSSVNGTYAAVTGTNSTQVVGSPLTGPGGVPQAFANPGAITTATTPQMVSVIFPGMVVLGSTPANSVILPYGTASTTGTGGIGTYQLSASQTSAITAGSVIFAWDAFYYSAATGGSGPAGSALTVRPPSTSGDFVSAFGVSNASTILPLKTGWGGALGNLAMLTKPFPTQTSGAPSTSDLASICTKVTDIRTYAATHALNVQSLYRLNDLGVFGDSSYATIIGYLSGASGTSGGSATLNVVSTSYGSLALASGTATAKLSGVGLPVQSSASATIAATIPLTTSAGSTYTVTFPSGVTSVNLGSVGSPVTLAVGAFLPALPIQSNTVKGYIDTDPTSHVSTLHVTSLDDGTTHSGFASFTGTLGTSFTARIDDGGAANVNPGKVLTVTAPVGAAPSNAYIGIGTMVCPAVGSSAFTCAAVTSLGTGVGYNGTYNLDPAVAAQNVTGQVMFGSGTLPGPATTLQASGVTGTIQTGMVVTDGGSSLTGSPLLITGGSSPNFTVAGNYYPPISADATMQATLTTLVPGEYIQNSAITNPVKIVGYGAGVIGLAPGAYTLSANPNAAGSVGSSGSPVVFTGTTITDGGAIAPGPALTIRDQGPFITFPLTNIAAKTGTIALSGTYDFATLGGTPSGIQVLVSNSANGPPLAGCTPCNWGALTGTISGGKWSGTIAGIPGGGPYLVSVRAANGIGYATMPNSIKVGWVFALWGQGQADSIQTPQSGYYTSYFSGLWGYGGFSGNLPGNDHYLVGPPIIGNFVPAQAFGYAGDRFGVGTSAGSPLSEAYNAFDQELSNAFGVPAMFLSATRDGVGVGLQTLGNAPQTQTIGAGDGSNLTWCSASKFCGHLDVGQPLLFNAASLTGGWFSSATITNPSSVPTFAAGTRVGGALEPGMVLNTPNAPTLIRCLTGCLGNTGASRPFDFSGSTWLLSNALDVGVVPTRADAPASLLPFGATTTPWPNLNIQQAGASVYAFAGFGTPLVKAGTFKVSVNGTVVCQDSQTFAYNQTGANCAGATIASSFVNYQTGDYQITFTSGNAPALNAAVVATWTSIVSPDANATALSRPQGLDFFGDGTAQSGAESALFDKAPGGVNGHIYSGVGTDKTYMFNSGGPTNVGYQYGGLSYSQMISWLFDAKFPALVPGASPGVSLITTGQWRVEGPVAFSQQGNFLDGIHDQWTQDIATQSLFTGHTTAATSKLTLDADTTYPMWEGEILGCVTLSTNCTIGPYSGNYITGLASGAWGKSGSTYTLGGTVIDTAVSQALQNPVYYSGPGPAFYAGTLNDIIVQSQGLSGTVGRNPHTAAGFTGGRRATSRWAAMIYGNAPGNATPATDPKVDRVKADAGANGCDAAALAAPCFDDGKSGTGTVDGGPYKSSFSTATWTGNTVTISGGLGAHARPFVVGQAFFCAGCNTGLVVTALDVPPTESTAVGAGEVGQTFHLTVKNAAGQAVGGSGSGAVTAGCSGTSGTGSNCIDVAIAINVSGTFGTAAAIATCGANNLNGNAPNYVVPNGKCQDNGIGEIVRTFRVGTNQAMYGSNSDNPTAGSVFDDGVDISNGQFVQNSAFTCNIVAAKVIQCVKAPSFNATTGAFSLGQWSSGSTYISYGDLTIVSGRLGSVLGYVGGQSFPFTPGSGYTNGTTTVTATCTTIQSLARRQGSMSR